MATPQKDLTQEVILKHLAKHDDPEVRELTAVLASQHARQKRILSLVQEMLQQIKMDMKYLVYDLECTRRERDELKGKQ